MSFYRFSHILLSIGLIVTASCFYLSHKKKSDIIDRLKSYKIQEDLYLVDSPYGFPALSADATPNTEYDIALPLLLEKCLPSEGHVLHIGGLSGIHTLLINQLQPNLKITATEGQPLFYGLFKKNINLHEKGHLIKLHNLNPSNHPHTLKVCRDSEDKGGCSAEACNCLSIKEDRLDTLSIPGLSFVLIESHLEANKVLEGLTSTLQESGYPPILVFPNVVFGKTKESGWRHILKDGKYMIYKVIVDTAHKKLTLQQIDSTHIQKDGPCFILITPELMPVTL